MFTNDPVKGDPSKIVLNLVEGDGEALVSGQANPTQIIVSKRNLQILNKVNRFIEIYMFLFRVAKNY